MGRCAALREVEELEGRPVASTVEDSCEDNELSTEEVEGSPLIPVLDAVSLLECVEDENVRDVEKRERRPVASFLEDGSEENELSTEEVKGDPVIPVVDPVSLVEGIEYEDVFEVEDLDRRPAVSSLEDSGDENETTAEGVKGSPVISGVEAVSLLEGIEDDNIFEVEELD